MTRPDPFPQISPKDQPGLAAETLLCVDPGDAGLLHDDLGRIVSAALPQITAQLLASLRPDRVICALFGPAQDAYAVVEQLESLGYDGAITVLCPDLPRPKLVEAELRAIGPGLRLTLLPMR